MCLCWKITDALFGQPEVCVSAEDVKRQVKQSSANWGLLAVMEYIALTDARYDVWCMSTALSHRTIKTALWGGTNVCVITWEPGR